MLLDILYIRFHHQIMEIRWHHMDGLYLMLELKNKIRAILLHVYYVDNFD